ncbi:MAG: RluA family pseudouridine synthase [Planctomycetes bacterium]|uniref:RluA family pseudouridine synthase n=1 Tax=Candidatus Wunengus californicus TaxID=3367619 RepID=UPI0040283709|nr:RluA family pseudouridine synthase [Planctomycetota bacterium]
MSIQKFTFTHKDRFNTLLGFIALKLTVSKNKAKQLLDRRMVFVNKKRAWIASYQLNKGDVVEVITREIKPQEFEKDCILFKDNHYPIVAKPPDIVTNGPDSLEEQLRTYFQDNHIQAVHRLDKDTSGVVIFAMNEDAFERMKTLFKKNLMKKVYRVIVRGSVGKQTFTINTPIRGQQAVTHVKLLKRGKEASYLEVNIETGRTHQIRIHLASIGHPVIGETEYDRKPIEHQLLRQIRRQMLHAYQIFFVHPYTQKMVSVTANIPEDFNQCLKLLGLGNR